MPKCALRRKKPAEGQVHGCRAVVVFEFLLFVMTSSLILAAQSHPIDEKNSKVTVHVSKAGLFSGFGDNHEVEAPISEGFVDETKGMVGIVIDSRRMRVLDPQLPPDKRQQVQDRMLGPDVLDVA